MAVIREIEIVSTILDFSPPKETDPIKKGKPYRDLGEVGGLRLRYGNFTYERRVHGIPGEPRLGLLTRQPTLAAIGLQEVRVLANPSDVLALGSLAGEIADHLTAIREKHQIPT